MHKFLRYNLVHLEKPLHRVFFQPSKLFKINFVVHSSSKSVFYSTNSKYPDSGNRLIDDNKSSSKKHSLKGKIVAKIKSSFKYDNQVKSYQFITPLRAMEEYMLNSSDLDKLEKLFSRSAYSHETRTLVYRRSDVEELAYKKYGGIESFKIRFKHANDVKKSRSGDIFLLKSALDLFKRSSENKKNESTSLWGTASGRVVLTAVGVNLTNFCVKLIAWWFTGSKSIFAEMVHSMADTVNQLILAYGLRSSLQKPDLTHPYGYHPLSNVSSLISGVGIFILGAGLSIWQGIHGIMYPEEISSVLWGLGLMGFSAISECMTLIMAFRLARIHAKNNSCTLREYLSTGMDPSTTVILLEDAAAVFSVLIASTCFLTSFLTNNLIWDSVGAISVGCLLACVAGFIVKTNSDALLAHSIPRSMQNSIMNVLEKNKIIRGTYDIKATQMGGNTIRFKAEVDVDGRELTRRYLEQADLESILKEMQAVKTQEQVVIFILKHGDNIVNILGAEINKIEADIKKEFPAVKHIDIEIN